MSHTTRWCSVFILSQAAAAIVAIAVTFMNLVMAVHITFSPVELYTLSQLDVLKALSPFKMSSNVYTMIQYWSKSSSYTKKDLIAKVWDLIFVKQIFIVEGITATQCFPIKQQASALEYVKKKKDTHD